jgi:hypothetical protein
VSAAFDPSLAVYCSNAACDVLVRYGKFGGAGKTGLCSRCSHAAEKARGVREQAKYRSRRLTISIAPLEQGGKTT